MFDLLVTVLLLVIIGLGAGTVGSMLGVGGGIMMVPALSYLGITPTQIASTSLFAVSSTSVSSTVEYSRQRRIDYKLGVLMAAVAVPGAIIGAVLSGNLGLDQFRLYFGILLVLAGIYILYKNSILKENVKPKMPARYRYLAVSSASLVAGIISSLFGVGGGVIFVPVMLLVLGIGMHRAAATSQLILMITSIAGVLTHVALGHPDYLFAIALSAGAFAGAQIGARKSKSAKDLLLQKILGGVLIVVGARMMLDWILSR